MDIAATATRTINRVRELIRGPQAPHPCVERLREMSQILNELELTAAHRAPQCVSMVTLKAADDRYRGRRVWQTIY